MGTAQPTADPLPDVRDWARRTAGLSAAEIVDALQHDQLRRWRLGERVPAEAYLDLLPPGSDPDLALDLVYAEFLLRGEHGNRPTLGEYAWRFPALADRLRLLVELEDGLAAADESVGTPAPGLFDVPGYTVLAEVGRGAHGVVYRAVQHGLNRTVALKVVRAPDPEARARFRVEAEAAARLAHPHIVQIYEVGEADAGPYLALEYAPGGSLADRPAPTTPREAAALVEPVARAVHHAHQHGVLHRDLKPANILLGNSEVGTRSAERDTSSALRVPSSEFRPKVADFGLARIKDSDSARTRTGAVLGTPCYMAPEQAVGRSADVDVRADVYSLGAILYELLAGRPPFQAATPLATLEAVRAGNPIPPGRLRPGLPRDLETVCLKCLRVDPKDRYRSAEALADDLGRFLRGEPVQARRISFASRLVRWMRRHPARTTAIGFVVVLILSTALASYASVRRERDRYHAEHDRAVAHLYQSLLGEARAIRLARAPGYRAEALARLEQALALDTPARDPLALRQEAVACLGDFVGLEPAAWSDFPQNSYAVALAVRPDGGELALGMTDGSVFFRDPATGSTTGRLTGHKSGVFAIAYGPSGNRLATADDAGSVRVWDRKADGWAPVRTLAVPKSGRPNYVHAAWLAFSPDGRRLYGCPRGSTRVVAWDPDTGAELATFATPTKERLYAAGLSRDGKWLAAAVVPVAGDGVVVWDAATGAVRHRLTPGLGPVNDVVFSPSGAYLACAAEGGVAVFDAPNFRPRLFVRGDAPNAVAFSPDDRLLAIPALEFGLVRLWDVRANREAAVLKHGKEPHAVAFTPDGSNLIGIGATLAHVWNLRGSGERLSLPGHAGGVLTVRFGADGRLVSAGADGRVQITDARSGRVLGALTGLGDPTRADVTADGRTLVTADTTGAIRTWDATDPAAIRPLTTYAHSLGDDIFHVAISPDGAFLAAAGDRGLILWRRDDPVGVRLTDRSAFALTFTPDGRALVWSATGSDRLVVRDLRTGVQSEAPLEDTNTVRFPIFPDGRRVARVNQRHEITVVDLAGGGPTATLGVLDFGGQSSFFMGRTSALTADGAWLAVQAPAVPVWDVAAARLLFTLPAGQTFPNDLAWGAGRDLLAVGSRDGELVVWDVRALRASLRVLGLDW